MLRFWVFCAKSKGREWMLEKIYYHTGQIVILAHKEVNRDRKVEQNKKVLLTLSVV